MFVKGGTTPPPLCGRTYDIVPGKPLGHRMTTKPHAFPFFVFGNIKCGDGHHLYRSELSVTKSELYK